MIQGIPRLQPTICHGLLLCVFGLVCHVWGNTLLWLSLDHTSLANHFHLLSSSQAPKLLRRKLVFIEFTIFVWYQQIVQGAQLTGLSANNFNIMMTLFHKLNSPLSGVSLKLMELMIILSNLYIDLFVYDGKGNPFQVLPGCMEQLHLLAYSSFPILFQLMTLEASPLPCRPLLSQGLLLLLGCSLPLRPSTYTQLYSLKSCLKVFGSLDLLRSF